MIITHTTVNTNTVASGVTFLFKAFVHLKIAISTISNYLQKHYLENSHNTANFLFVVNFFIDIITDSR